VIWGLGGAGIAHLANHSGETPEALVQLRIWVQDSATGEVVWTNRAEVPEALVQLRIWVQDSATGEVVWTNRAEVKVAPQTVYGDKRSKEMFKTAVNRATTLLVDDFWNKTKAIM
jgi:hypothetical protein